MKYNLYHCQAKSSVVMDSWEFVFGDICYGRMYGGRCRSFMIAGGDMAEYSHLIMLLPSLLNENNLTWFPFFRLDWIFIWKLCAHHYIASHILASVWWRHHFLPPVVFDINKSYPITIPLIKKRRKENTSLAFHPAKTSSHIFQLWPVASAFFQTSVYFLCTYSQYKQAPAYNLHHQILQILSNIYLVFLN